MPPFAPVFVGIAPSLFTALQVSAPSLCNCSDYLLPALRNLSAAACCLLSVIFYLLHWVFGCPVDIAAVLGLDIDLFVFLSRLLH